MAAPPPTSSGAPRSSARLDELLAELARGRSAALELVGRAGHRQDAAARRARTLAPTRAGISCCSGLASELERDLPFWVFVDALDEYVEGLDPRRRSSASTTTCAPSSPRLPVALAARRPAATPPLQRRALPHPSRGARAARAARRPTSRWCWCSTTSTGLTRRRSSCSGRCCAGRRPRRCWSMAVRRGSCPSGWRPRSSGRTAPGRSPALELGALTRARRDELLGEPTSTATRERAALRGERRQPVLPRAARPLARSAARAARRAGAADPLDGLGVPPAVAAALAEELALLSDGARHVLDGAAVAGDPFEPELAAAAAATSEAARSRRSTSCCGSISSATPTCRAAFASGTRSSGARSTSPRRRLATRRPRAQRRRRSPSAARRRRRARTTSSARRARATPPPSRSCARPARTPLSRARDSAARWFAAALRLLPDDGAGRGARRAAAGARGALAATGQFAEGHAALLESLALVPADSVGAAGAAHGGVRRRRALLGRHERGARPPHGALEQPRRPDRRPRRSALMIELAIDGLYRLEFEPMREWAGAGARDRAAARRPAADRGRRRRPGVRRRARRRDPGGGRSTARRRRPWSTR